MKKPWDENFVGSDDDLNAAWKNTKASDYVFYVFNSVDWGPIDGILAVITPKEYFEQEGCCWDGEYYNLDHILNPDVFYSEEQNGTYAPMDAEKFKTVDELTKHLLSLGFVQNEEFTEFMKEVVSDEDDASSDDEIALYDDETFDEEYDDYEDDDLVDEDEDEEVDED